MTIKSQGGIFRRNPTFNDVEVDGTLTVGGNVVPDASTLLVDGDIGSTVQAYDADTAKLDVIQTFSAAQTFGDISNTGNAALQNLSSTNSPLNISSSASDGSATINSSGQISIGTTTAQSKLNVASSQDSLKYNEGITVFRSVGSNRMYLNCVGGGTNIVASNSPIVFFYHDQSNNNVTELARFNTTGNLSFPSGQGIDFSATSGTGTSELFDDYEEGSYTLTFYDAASGGNASSTTATAYYTKVGRTVTISCAFVANISTAGMTGGNVLYVSLPFAPDGTIGSSVGNSVFQSMTYPASGTATYLSIGTGARANFISQASAGTTTNITVGDVTSGTTDLVRLSATYIAA